MLKSVLNKQTTLVGKQLFH